MDALISKLLTTDWHILLGMFGMLWIFSLSLGKKFDKLEGKIDKLDGKINDLDKRIVVIETLLHMKECCVLKEDKHLRKAE